MIASIFSCGPQEPTGPTQGTGVGLGGGPTIIEGPGPADPGEGDPNQGGLKLMGPGQGGALGPDERPMIGAGVDPTCQLGAVIVVDPETGKKKCQCVPGTVRHEDTAGISVCVCPLGDLVRENPRTGELLPCREEIVAETNPTVDPERTAIPVAGPSEEGADPDALPFACRTILYIDERLGSKPVTCCSAEECRRLENEPQRRRVLQQAQEKLFEYPWWQVREKERSPLSR